MPLSVGVQDTDVIVSNNKDLRSCQQRPREPRTRMSFSARAAVSDPPACRGLKPAPPPSSQSPSQRAEVEVTAMQNGKEELGDELSESALVSSRLLQQVGADLVGAQMTGWLYKKGGINTGVQRRYFVLDEGVLTWYTSPQNAEVKRAVRKHYTQYLRCHGLEIEPDTGEDGNGRFWFAIKALRGSTKRRIELACECKSLRLKWVQALQMNQSHWTSSGPTILKRIFGIGPHDISGPASRLIHPQSPFALVWLWVTCVCLAYTAIVTPAVLSFHWLDAPCDTVPTLYFDCFLDVFFLCDILVSFCLGVSHRGKYFDDWKWVAWNYATSSFPFDLCTSIPVSFVELAIQAACSAATPGDELSENANSIQLRFVRILKPLRWLKLSRIIKLNGFGNILASVCDMLDVQPRYQRLFLLAVHIIGLIHLGGCLVWMVKITSSDEEIVHDFIADLHEGDHEVDLSTLNGKLSAYGICTYFVTTVFSTVGFGDISANNAVERAFFSLLMLYGIIVFGNVLAELGEVNRVVRTEESEKLEKLQTAADFMRGFDVSKQVVNDVFKWTRFHHEHKAGNIKRKEFLESLPRGLQRQLVTEMFGNVLKQVPLFELLHEEGPSFLSQVWLNMTYENFAPDTPIVTSTERATRLIVVVSGEITVIVEKNDESQVDELSFTAGDFLGDFALLGDNDWGSSILISMPNINLEVFTRPNTFAVCLILEQADFQKILDDHDLCFSAIVDSFQHQFREHKQEVEAKGREETSANDGAPKTRKQVVQEMLSFVRSNRLVRKWGRFASEYIKKSWQLMDKPNASSDVLFRKVQLAMKANISRKNLEVQRSSDMTKDLHEASKSIDSRSVDMDRYSTRSPGNGEGDDVHDGEDGSGHGGPFCRRDHSDDDGADAHSLIQNDSHNPGGGSCAAHMPTAFLMSSCPGTSVTAVPEDVTSEHEHEHSMQQKQDQALLVEMLSQVLSRTDRLETQVLMRIESFERQVLSRMESCETRTLQKIARLENSPTS